MKTMIGLFILAASLSLVSCSATNDDNPNPSGTKTDQVKGNWIVTYFYDSGKNETHKFSGYSFNFEANGTLTATSSAAGNYTGSWRIGETGDDDDNSSNKLVIMITGNTALDELQDDWLIVRLTSAEIWLKDDGDDSDEELRFGK